MKTLTYDQVVNLVIEQAEIIEILGMNYNVAETLREIDYTAFKEYVLEFANTNNITIE